MYGFTITKQGRKLLASLIAGQQLVILGVQVGSGKVPEGQDPRDLTALIAPFAEATTTTPVRDNDKVSFIVEYRSDMGGGLTEGRYLNEYGVFALDPEDGKVLLYYANLGDYPEWVFAYSATQPPTIRRYPVQIGVATDAEVVLDFKAGAFVTADEVTALVNKAVEEAGGTSEEKVKNLISEHNSDPNAHSEVLAQAVQTTFDKLVEQGTVIDKEEVQTLIAQAIAAGGGSYGGLLDLTIPAAGWTPAEAPTEEYAYTCDVAAEGITADHWPIGAPKLGSFTVGQEAGVVGGCETMDGYVRFYSKRIPTADIQATIVVFTKGSTSGNIATKDTPGVVKPGDGLTVGEDGTLSLDLGSGLALDETGKVQVDTETVVTGADMVNEEEVKKDVADILNGEDDDANT